MPEVGEIIDGNFGRLELQQPLGSGGMAEVFLAANLDEHGQQYALKFVREELLDDEELIERFINEAKNLRNLAHPNIVRFYDFYALLPDYAYIVMDYIDGASLQRLLRGYGQRDTRIPPLTFTLPLLARLGMALTRIHNANTIHRDVKTANILIRQKDCEVFLSDLGIARNLQHSQFMTQGVVGTMAYMAPEQHQNRPLSPATDIYALGTIAYELCTGRRPFLGDLDTRADPSLISVTRNEAIMVQRLTMPPLAPSVVNTDLPEAVDQVFYKVLSIDPEKRYARANEFIEALHQALLPALPAELGDIHTLGQTLPYPPPPAFLPADAQQSTGVTTESIEITLPPEHQTDSAPRHTEPDPVERAQGTQKKRAYPLFVAIALAVLALGGGVIAWRSGLLTGASTTPTAVAAQPTATNTPTDVPEDEDEPQPETEEPAEFVPPTAIPTLTATDTSTPPPSETPTEASTRQTVSRPKDNPAPTATPLSPTSTPVRPSSTPLPPTAPATHTPTRLSPTATPQPPTATPAPGVERSVVLANLNTLVLNGPVAFNCTQFNTTYAMLQDIDRIPDLSAEVAALYTLVDAPTDPMRRIYEGHCLNHADETATSLPGSLQNAFVQLVFDLEEFKSDQ